MEDVIIIGAGPAGISAALYTARSNLNPIVINNGIGALAKAEKIENYYGLEEPISGEELYERGLVQAKALGVRIIEAQVLGIKGFDTFTVQTTAGDFDTVSVILATGSRRTAPSIPGIREFEGKGVSYCAVCDAFFYRNREVAVLGNSDFALHEAEELRNVTPSVTIYTNGKEPEFSREHPIAVNTMKISTTIQRETKLFLGADNEETAELTVPMYDFGDWASRMKAYRKKNHITQQELAQLMGVKHFTLRSWEQKQAKPPYNVWRLHKHLFDDSIKLT